jgi:hypothetical protein
MANRLYVDRPVKLKANLREVRREEAPIDLFMLHQSRELASDTGVVEKAQGAAEDAIRHLALLIERMYFKGLLDEADVAYLAGLYPAEEHLKVVDDPDWGEQEGASG